MFHNYCNNITTAPKVRVELLPVTRRREVNEPLSLICSAAVMIRARTVIDPLNIEFSWLRSVNSRPQEQLTSSLYTNSRMFSTAGHSTLKVNLKSLGSHMYTCQVKVDVEPAPDIIMGETSVILEIVGQFFS